MNRGNPSGNSSGTEMEQVKYHYWQISPNKEKLMKLLLLTFILFFTTVINAKQGIDFEELKRELDSEVPEILKKNKAPGVAIAFVHSDKVIGFKAYGFADLDRKTQITAETMFNVASISKVVTAWGVMQLVQQGKVDLDKPINNYLKRWKIPESNYGTNEVTLRNVLSHTSGLSVSSYYGWNFPDKLPTIVDSLQGNNNGAGILNVIHAPNSKWSYSGGGYSIVQLLIEDISGLSFEEYMQKAVLKPLGMNNSTFNVTKEVMDKSATPYDSNGNKTSMVYFSEKAAAGLHTTAQDLAHFNLAVLRDQQGNYNGSHVLSEKWINEMVMPTPNTDGRWSMSYMLDKPNASLAFSGFNNGWIGLTRSIVDKNYGYVVLTNSSIESVSNEIDSFILTTVNQDVY